MTMIEKIARAIDPDQWEAFDAGRLFRKADLSSWKAATAALQALRDAGPAMIEAADALYEYQPFTTILVSAPEPEQLWQVMVDAALESSAHLPEREG